MSLLTYLDTHFGINVSHNSLVMILAIEGKVLTERKLNESCFGPGG